MAVVVLSEWVEVNIIITRVCQMCKKSRGLWKESSLLLFLILTLLKYSKENDWLPTVIYQVYNIF